MKATSFLFEVAFLQEINLEIMEISLDGVIINYRLVRKKIKNLYMKFNENGTLEVKAPKSMPQSLIDRFLKEKIKWIIIQKNRYDLMLDEKETDIFKEGEFKSNYKR